MFTRITTKGPPDWIPRTEEEITSTFYWWGKLKRYRQESYPEAPSRMDDFTAQQALARFTEQNWAHELSQEQLDSGSKKKSALGVKLHQHFHWKQAAVAIITQNLPMPDPELPLNSDSPLIQEMDVKLDFVTEMANWILSFAQIVSEYRQNPRYQSDRNRTPQLQHRRFCENNRTRIPPEEQDGSTTTTRRFHPTARGHYKPTRR